MDLSENGYPPLSGCFNWENDDFHWFNTWIHLDFYFDSYWFIFAVCGLCGMVIPQWYIPRTVRTFFWIPHDGMTGDPTKDVRHHRGEETGGFRRHHGQGPEPCAACYFLIYIYIVYIIYIIQYVISCGQTTITWCFLACWPAKNWLIHSELKSATSIAWWPLAIRHRSAFFSPAVWAQERHCRILQSSLLYLWDVIEIVDSSWCSVVVNLLQVWFSHVFTRLESYGKRKHQ